jgi:hypothetical protein
MGAGYELRPVTIARPAGQRPIRVLASLGLLVALVLLAKPWATWPTTATDGQVLEPAAAATEADPPRPLPVEPAAPVIGSLARHSGTWGVGTAGLVARDLGGSWVDWAPVTPVDVDPTAGPPAADGGPQPCVGRPVVGGAPLFVAISSPADVPVDRRLVAWRLDDGQTISLADSIRQVTAVGDTGISYLVQLDRAPWAAGAYEFRMIAGDRAVSLAVCLATTP